MKRLLKRLILIALVLYVAVHFFDFDLGGTAQNLTSAAKAAAANASRFLSRAWIQTKRFAALYGVNLDFSWLTFGSLTGRRSGGSGGGTTAPADDFAESQALGYGAPP